MFLKVYAVSLLGGGGEVQGVFAGIGTWHGTANPIECRQVPRDWSQVFKVVQPEQQLYKLPHITSSLFVRAILWLKGQFSLYAEATQFSALIAAKGAS